MNNLGLPATTTFLLNPKHIFILLNAIPTPSPFYISLGDTLPYCILGCQQKDIVFLWTGSWELGQPSTAIIQMTRVENYFKIQIIFPCFCDKCDPTPFISTVGIYYRFHLFAAKFYHGKRKQQFTYQGKNLLLPPINKIRKP